jgi:hypothetical protein
LNTSLVMNLWMAHYSAKSQLLWNRSNVRVNGERVFWHKVVSIMGLEIIKPESTRVNQHGKLHLHYR